MFHTGVGVYPHFPNEKREKRKENDKEICDYFYAFHRQHFRRLLP